MKLRLFILSGLCAWIGVSCGGKKENTGQESIRPVRVVKVESLGAMQKMYTGVVQAEEYSKLAFKVSGPLVEMNVDAGSGSEGKDIVVHEEEGMIHSAEDSIW